MRCGGFAPDVLRFAIAATAQWFDRHAPTGAKGCVMLARHRSVATSPAAITLICFDVITSRPRW